MGTTGAVKTAAITKTEPENILRERKTEKSTGWLARKTGNVPAERMPNWTR